MNAVAGIVHLDGAPAGAGALEYMLRSMGHWGHDAGLAQTDGASLGSVGSSAFVPRVDGDRGFVITCAARLDNRDVLSAALGVGRHEQLTLSDECLLVRAFERWGEACPEQVSGDWSLAVWSPQNRRLFLARDHFGNTCLHYARSGERVAFASDIKALLSIPWVPRRLNDTHVSALLVGGGIGAPDTTIYRDIFRLPPAHTLVITPNEVRTARYWRVEDTPDSGPSAPAERAALLRETLRLAVSSRLGARDHIGSMLSGGLDSGAVTAFAAQHLKEHGRRLTAFTSVPAFPTPPSRTASIDEGPAALEVVRSFDSIDHVPVPARTVSPLTGIRRATAILGEPMVPAINGGWLTVLMAEANARGIEVLLTGPVGDLVMAGRPAEPNWRRDFSARRYRRVVRRLAPDWTLRLRRLGWKPWRLAEPPWRTYSVVNAEFARETRTAERLRDVSRDPRATTARMAAVPAGAFWAPFGAAFGIEVLDPLQDRRVMEQMFSGPAPPMAEGTDRWLFRESLVGILPEDVRLSRSKGRQSADIVERLIASWTEVEEALALAEASPLARRCIDLPYCRILAESLRSSQPPDQGRARAAMLLDGLSMAAFLAETW